MKLFFAVTIVFASALAMASFKTAAEEKQIICESADGDHVTLNKARASFRVHIAGNEGSDLIYSISKKNTDGDTFVSFVSADYNGAVLSLDDRGDNLVFSDTREGFQLNCR
jgi:hypothetical protein